MATSHQRNRSQTAYEVRRQPNPFKYPYTSESSSEDGSASEQGNHQMPIYEKSASLAHRRQISKGSSIDKPNLNIITNLHHPVMPMKVSNLTVGDTAVKKGRTERNRKAISIVSQHAVPATASPLDPPASQISPSMIKKLVSLKKSSKSNGRLGEAMLKKKQDTAYTQRIPFGITIPQEHATQLEETMTDSALPISTPITPAIVITPADPSVGKALAVNARTQPQPSPSSTYSSMKYQHPGALSNTKQIKDGPRSEARAGFDSAGLSCPDSADPSRPMSQGWWNLMLSPLMRAASIASLKSKAAGQRPPVPPMPFTTERGASPPVSARSDLSFLVSLNDSSPDTPRRQGLASARASTWSRWTEWENDRDLNEKETIGNPSKQSEEEALVTESTIHCDTAAKQGPGLATEYYHACAAEQVTGRPFYECINHDCNQRPQLIRDEMRTNRLALGSPFQSPLRDNEPVGGSHEIGGFSSPSEARSPAEFSPRVREANATHIIKVKPSITLDDKAGNNEKGVASPTPSGTKNNETVKPLPVSHATESMPEAGKAPNTMTTKILSTTVEAEENREDHLPNASGREMFGEPSAAQAVMSPSPMSPQATKTLGEKNAMALDEVRTVKEELPPASRDMSQLPQRPAFVNAETKYSQLPDRRAKPHETVRDLNERNRQLTLEQKRRKHEKQDARAKKVDGSWSSRGCFSKLGCMSRGGQESRAKRKWIALIASLLALIIIISIVLALTLTRKGDSTPVGSQWLNLTGFPAMPTGILTIAVPALTASQNQCVAPTTMWSCSVPKEDYQALNGSSPDQPNFRFEIRFKNGTVASNLTIPLDGTSTRKPAANDPFANENFTPVPAPPDEADQLFMGNTTDNVTQPFNGEQTPFFISFMSSFPIVPNAFATATSSRLARRQNDSSSLTNEIPSPDLANDGSAANTTLLPTDPYPVSQPVHLYNRGLPDEHYGFYMYYDKSIFLSGLKLNGTQLAFENSPEIDQDGGCTKNEASVRCTFSQTRFLVRFYTQPGFAELLQSDNNTNLQDPNKKQTPVSSATDFTRPGSFPYPAELVLDRHGGDIDTKLAYCYGMNNGEIVRSDKVIVGELRSFGGQLINAAPSIFGSTGNFSQSAGGIDGGTGGCTCVWQNFQ